MVSARRQFSTEFKIEAVRLAESSTSPSAVARQLGVRADLLRKWRQQFRGTTRVRVAAPGSGTETRVTSQDDEIRRLRREVAQLKEERDILKKATAFFARESR